MNAPTNTTVEGMNRKQRRAAAKAARQELKNNAAWDDLHGLNQNCRALLLNNAHVGRILNDQNIMQHIPDHETLTRLVRTLTSDLQNMNTELSLIGKLHEGRSGKAEDTDILLTFEIAEKYHMFTEQHAAIVQPTVNHILELTAAAEQAIVDAQNGVKDEVEVVAEDAPQASLVERADDAKMAGDVIDADTQQ